MVECLYLDTARLGRMSPRACRAAVDLTRFANEYGPSLYFLRLLEDGFSAWPESLRRQYPGLADWTGVDGLCARLKRSVGAASEHDCIVASRSAALMRFTGRLLFGPCRNVLVTDLTWPAYRKLLVRERAEAAAVCTPVAIRRRILAERMTSGEVVEAITRAYLANGCDGLFLPLVDNLGIELPIRAIVASIRARAPVRFVAVDGAQSIGHVYPDLQENYCDLFIAGCHKWLRAYHPMGVAIFGNPATRDYVTCSLERWQEQGWLDDPLLAFTQDIRRGRLSQYGETVSLTSLFTANAACLDLDRISRERLGGTDRENRQSLRSLIVGTPWRMIETDAELETRIALLKRPVSASRGQSARSLGQSWLEQGVSATAMSKSLVRVSLPDFTLDDRQLLTLEKTLNCV